jgi:predicted alpha/beta superfamily hydrolase
MQFDLVSPSSLPGALHHYQAFPSRLVDPRPVDVWLPPEYDHLPKTHYPVLYMHDGQNLFDSKQSRMNVDWGVAETLVQLTGRGKIHPHLVVGIWNVKKRWLEYIPAQPCETPEGAAFKQAALEKYGLASDLKIDSDSFLRFLVEELKPFIDQQYRTRPEQERTLIMGSSMGGLSSLNAVCTYPQVFRGAGCLSTHWTALGSVGVQWVKKALPYAGQHRLYFDHGTEGLDAEYEQYQIQVDQILVEHGFTQNVDCLTLKFNGADHNEAAWRQRLPQALEFLLR